MIKCIIFDLDGVLIDSRDVHYETLNTAIARIDPSMIITRNEHLAKYDGLSTTKKLEILCKEKNLNSNYCDIIWQEKQKATYNIFNQLTPNFNLLSVFQTLKNQGYIIGVCSNSIRNTVKIVLLRLGILEYVDVFLSNEDVTKPKPYPEIFWQCMQRLNVTSLETLILEDSHVGRTAALNSGAHLLTIENHDKVTLDIITEEINKINNNTYNKVPWTDSKLNVVIPMAGQGSRFSEAGYVFPKPLIEINNKPMIQTVVENLNIKANYIFLVLKDHCEKYNLKQLLNLISPGCKIVEIDELTEGAACTILKSKDLINNNNPLLIANSDQFIEWNANECMYSFSSSEIDGGILTFESTHPKWSFVKLGEDGFVSEVAEKNPISSTATVGIYYWKNGSDFVKYAEQMIIKNIRVNNEFYVCPVFNEAIQDNKKIKIKKISRMWGLGTPIDLKYFLDNYKDS